MTFNNATNTPKLVSDGQLFIGSSGANPIAANLIQGANITITNGSGTIEIASSVGNLTINQIGLQYLSPGTYNYVPSSGLIYAFVQVLGGAGGGGGTTNSGADDVIAGSGGGGGGYTEAFISAATIGAGQVVTVGAGGIGVITADGTDGTTSSFGSLLVGNPGQGGSLGSAGGQFIAGGSGGGFTGTSCLYGYAGQNGGTTGPGSDGTAPGLPTYSYAGFGGGCFTGYTETNYAWSTLSGAVGASGNTATEPGVGGSGGFSAIDSADTMGGSASAGRVLITEYIVT